MEDALGNFPTVSNPLSVNEEQGLVVNKYTDLF